MRVVKARGPMKSPVASGNLRGMKRRTFRPPMRNLSFLAIFLALFCGPMANAWADRWPVRQYNLRKDTHDPKKSLGKRQLKLHRLLEGRNKKPVPLKRANLKQRRGR